MPARRLRHLTCASGRRSSRSVLQPGQPGFEWPLEVRGRAPICHPQDGRRGGDDDGGAVVSWKKWVARGSNFGDFLEEKAKLQSAFGSQKRGAKGDRLVDDLLGEAAQLGRRSKAGG